MLNWHLFFLWLSLWVDGLFETIIFINRSMNEVEKMRSSQLADMSARFRSCELRIFSTSFILLLIKIIVSKSPSTHKDSHKKKRCQFSISFLTSDRYLITYIPASS